METAYVSRVNCGGEGIRKFIPFNNTGAYAPEFIILEKNTKFLCAFPSVRFQVENLESRRIAVKGVKMLRGD